MDTGSPSFDWVGKILQAAQTGLLIATFSLGLVERQSNREADRYRELVFDFTTEQLETLYSRTQGILDSFQEDFDRAFYEGISTESFRGVAISRFQTELYHARRRVVSRYSCYSSLSPEPIAEAFDEMEDKFALEMKSWTPVIPIRNLAGTVADGSTRLIKQLLTDELKIYEMPPSGSLVKRMFMRFDRWIDAEPK